VGHRLPPLPALLPVLDDDLLTVRAGAPLRVGGGVVPIGLEKPYLIGLIATRRPGRPHTSPRHSWPSR
jgi:hypothetical protein